MMLKAYVGMLRRDHVRDDRMETLAAGLWREHREALEFLMERRPDDRYAVLTMLLSRKEEAATRLSQTTGLDIQADHSTKSNVRFAIADWDRFPVMRTAEGWTPSKRLLLIEVRESGGSTRVQFVLGPGPGRIKVFDALKLAGADIGGTHSIGEKFRQLANAAIAVDEAEDSEGKFEAVIGGIAAFIGKHREKYEAILAE